MDAVVRRCKNKNPFSQLRKQHHGKYSFSHKGNFPQNRKRGEHIIRIRAERKEMEINGMKQTTNDEKKL